MGFSLRADLAAIASVCERQQKAHHDGANGDAGTLAEPDRAARLRVKIEATRRLDGFNFGRFVVCPFGKDA